MKNYLIAILLTLTLSSLISCEKDNNAKSVVVIKDCTGDYLRYDSKDYLVCNRDKLADFDNNTNAIATFKRIETCSGEPYVVCMMYHQHEGYIEVKSIRVQ